MRRAAAALAAFLLVASMASSMPSSMASSMPSSVASWMPSSMASWMPSSVARADEPRATPALSGLWTATGSGGQVFAGTWTAEVAVSTPNVALGTWSLIDEKGAAVMGGTWSARKAPRGWRGAWSARVATTNQILSGTWEADDRTLKGAKTFRDLLARTAEKQIGGVWHMGRAHGNWWLRARAS